jgi:hypothetical protein
MKKNFNKKMNLNKETVVSLSSSKMNEIQGMGTQHCTDTSLCPTWVGPECPAPTLLVC